MADQIKATPRNSLAALLSDAINSGVGYMKSPQRTQQLQGLGRLIESTGIPYTAQSLSYDPTGRGLFTGAGGLGGTTRMRPEALEAAMTVAPIGGPAARVASRGLMAAGRAGERVAERVVPQIMERGGLGAEMLAAMSNRTVSRMAKEPASVFEPAGDLASAVDVMKQKPGSITDQRIIDKFGSKAERERLLQKRVLQDAEDEAAQDAANVLKSESGLVEEPSKNVRAAYKGKAVPADYWRQLQETQGEDAVLKAVRQGKHLRPDGKGGYIGAPRHIDSPQALTAFRRSLDQQFKDGVEIIEAADPTRLGTWYDRAKQGMAMSNEPFQLARTLDQQAVYSAGVAPETELAFALKHLNSRAVGEPTMAYRGAGMRSLDTAVAEDRPTALAFKTGEYREKNDPRVPNTGMFGVNDFRAAQGFGYTTPDGKIWKGGVTDTMHSFMDAETALAVDRARKANVGGRSDWQGPHLQEIPWVLGKAQDIYTRGSRTPGGRFAGPPGEGIAQAVREANKTAQDFFYKHTGSATHEEIPAAISGAKSIMDLSPAEKLAYSKQSSWTVDTPYSMVDAPTVGAGGRDAIFSALGVRQLPPIESTGLFTNALGQTEKNAMTISRPLLDFPTGGGGGLASSNTRQAMSLGERYRALVDAQEAGASNLANTANSLVGKNGILFDSRPVGNYLSGTQPTEQQLSAIQNLVNESGFGSRFGVTASNRGVNIFPFAGDALDEQAVRALNKLTPEIQKIFPSSPMKAINTLDYQPGITANRFTGEATEGFLNQAAQANPNIAMNLSESEALRNKIRANMQRDAAYSDFPQDVQNTRQFLSEADWSKAVQMIRQGVKPAAALAAMGYSLNSMAGQNQVPASPFYTDPFGNTIADTTR